MEKISDGTFDITIGTLSICGIFQRLQKPQNPMRTKSMHRLSLPRKKIEAALAHVNYKKS